MPAAGADGAGLCAARGARFDPATGVRNQFVGFNGPPASRVVLAEREIGAQHAVHDPPGGFDAGLTAKQSAVAAQRVAEEALVRRHLIALVVMLDESHVLA